LHLSAASVIVAVATALATAGAQTIAITGARVFPVSGPVIENGTVVIRDGKIAAVGADVTIPSGAQRIDARGKWVTPGLINPATQIGLREIGAVPETVEGNATAGDSIAAAFRVWEGFNPATVLLTPARNEGITSAVLLPGGGFISGQAGIVDLSGGDLAGVLRRGPIAIVASFGAPEGAGLTARGEMISRMREVLTDARLLSRRRAEFDRGESRALAAGHRDLGALLPVLEGRLPLLLFVDKASDIEAALRLAQEFNIRLIIGGGAEAWQVAGKLAAARVPVITGGLGNIPQTFDQLGAMQENAAMLRRAGVQVLLHGGIGEAFNVRNIRQEAGNAVAYGLPWNEALRAVTLAPAEAFGVAETVGSLQPGRDANVVVWSGDPFEFATRAERVYIKGQDVKEPSRQDMLIERYKTLPPTYVAPPRR
jgi:imidazolonepropionase-like amidohydrolase